MGWREWLAAFIGRGPQNEAEAEARAEDEARDWRLDFLSDLCGAGSGAAKDYRRLSSDADAARDEIDGAEDYEDDPERFLDTVFLGVCDMHGVASAIDWAEDADTLMENVNALIEARGATPLDEAARTQILSHVTAKQAKRGEHIGYAFGPLAEQLERRSLRLLDINEGSDCYHFIVAPNEFCEKWSGVELSAGLRIEDPGWQFKKQLRGSPYERFLNA